MQSSLPDRENRELSVDLGLHSNTLSVAIQ